MSTALETRSVRMLQAVWLVLALTGTFLWLVGPAAQSARIRSVCRPAASCAVYELDAAGARLLSSLGIGLTTYAALTILVLGGLSIIWYGLAGLIMWRKPDDRGAVVAAYFLVLFPLLEVATWIPSAPSAVQTLLPAAGVSVLLLFCLVFPDGYFSPRWARWLIPLCVIGGAAAFLPTAIKVAVLVGVLGGIVAAQVARYRSKSSWAQRQQTKWALFGVAATMAGFVLIALGLLLLPATQTGRGSLYLSFANSTGLAIASSAIPITIGIAVLRYQLWDINKVISLALVYTSLTVVLGAIYIGGVVGLQALLQGLAGNKSKIAIAVSTLAIAALFGPLRRRIQIEIDRRFYRRKYDAAKTLAEYGEHLREEIDLAQFCQDLTTVVRDTFEPEHVSLWLRE